MLKHHLKIAWRRLLAHKLNTLITLIGLSVGLASFLLIFHYATYELSFDHFHQNKDEIYRVVCYPKNGVPNARNYNSLGVLIRDKFPEAKEVVRFWRVWNSKDGDAFSVNRRIYYEKKVFQADSTFFQVFPSLLKVGHPETVLKEPNSVVISESKAIEYFGDKDPIGLVISDSKSDLKVTGIMFDTPKNSHFKTDIVRTYYDGFFLEENWEGKHLYTYLTINPNVNKTILLEKLEKTVRALKTDHDHLADVSFGFQRITDIHLGPNLSRELSSNVNKTLVIFILGIGVLILIMAWINHVNLSISSFSSRTKELSISGAIGADRSNLYSQALCEYLLLNISALPIALSMIGFANYYLTELDVIPSVPDGIYQPSLWMMMSIILIIGSIVAGLYPAILIRKIRFSGILTSKFSRISNNNRFRYSLIVIQFASSIILIVGVLILNLQEQHLKVQDQNMQLERVVTVRNPTVYTEFEPESEQTNNYTLFKEKLTSHPTIAYVTASSAIPGSSVGFNATNMIKRDRNDPYDPKEYKLLFVDDGYLQVYSIPLLAGRSFSASNKDDLDQKTIVLSKSAIDHLGYLNPNDAIGKTVDFDLWGGWKSYEIIGVFDDYAHESAKVVPFPSILYYARYESYIMHHLYYSIKITDGTSIESAMKHLNDTWTSIWPSKPMAYQFIDDVYEQQYHDEKVMEAGFTFFSLIAIILSCLGILGITHHEVQLRLKEISIRKVLGSTITEIIQLISWKYLRLILISMLIAIPISYFLGAEWLSIYPTRINLALWIFLVPVLLIVVLVLLTSGATSFKGASSNPAKVLRSE